MDLDEIRLKEIGELTDSDKKSLNENWGKLTEEEHKYFGEVHTQEDEDKGFKMEFKSEEEFNQYLDKRVEDALESRRKEKVEARQKAKEKDDDRIFPEGYKAKDWNEAFIVAMPKLEDRIVNRIQNMSQERQKQLAKIESEFDKEFDTIASRDKNVPAKGTQGREDWEAEVSQVGVKYKLTSMTDAYEVWKATQGSKANEEEGRTEIPYEGQPASGEQRRIASKVSRGYGSNAQPNKTRYVPGKRLDDLLDQRMREEGIES